MTTTESATDAAIEEARQRSFRQIAAASIGNAVEWYDWYTYTFLATVFATQIFGKTSSPGVALLNAFGIYAIGFFFRPIGGLLLGALADRWGRKNTLTLTILMMGLGSLIIAVTPTYASVGLLSPLLLIAGRVLSGFSIGGEFATNTTLLVESAPARRRGLFASFQYVSTTIGQLIASGLSVILVRSLSDHAMSSYGWRIPFFVGAALCVVGLWIRRGMVETGEAVRTEPEKRPGVFEAVRVYPRQTFLLIGVTIGITIGYYMWTTYLPTYAQTAGGVSKSTSLTVSTIGLAFFGLMQPVLGTVSDRVGRRPMMIGSIALFAIGIVPTLALIRSGPSFGVLLIVTLIGMLLIGCSTSISAAVNAELIPRRVRAAGIGFPYSVTVALFGGTAPYVGTLFTNIGRPGLFGWYIAVLCVISVIVYVIMPETAHKPLR